MSDTKKNTARICVREICGLNELTEADGKKIHKLILNHWGMCKRIEVDLARATPSPLFLYEAIGQLILQFKKAEIISKLKLGGLSAPDKKILNDIVVAGYHSLNKPGDPRKP